ncbi:subtilisin-like serine protease [Bernardetia litoralis DSM 6794]|uniref:Subtilisin-like serine protease n=1 Tax=Bernardetia litoralis (strain ATCC 23117 / DSM 6794 / NBRC 15988 / NCIMB 1366 / Fx l1 / Sio-4) TaxID=880071 RepID=I4AML9_BERLS|nr:S8 family serine peptidase [Bernardetia litoralis]AFM05204.1 subtilisin-like serine protease [Bernardetia litoralis DSM 6794]
MKLKQLLFITSIILFGTGFSYTAFSQTTERVVYFKDKNGTTFSTSRPLEFLTQKSIDRRNKQGISITEQDLPVNTDYISQINNLGASVSHALKWFNAAIVTADETTFIEIENLSFVDKIDRVAINLDTNRVARISATCDINTEDDICPEFEVNKILKTNKNQEDFDYGSSLAQIQMLGVDKMHQQGYLGQGIHIAVLDGGFINANTLSAFSHADIAFVYDVVENGQNVYQASSHGTKVLSAMLSKKEGEIIGTAPEATYYLFRTEDVSKEFPIEEAFWAVGAEKADSLGVDILQTSLGYSDFDNSDYDYTHDDLDGNTAMISQAAEFATQKGIVVVTSAGNSGNSAWQKISFPADAPSVLAVGAVDSNEEIGNFSSIGNTADGRVKPDIMAMGVGTTLWSEQNQLTSGNGTSYAAPLIAGLVAGFMQKNPNLTQKEVMFAMRRAGDNYSTPNEQYGYGIPNFDRLTQIELILGQEEDLTNKDAQIRIFPNPVASILHIEIDEKLFITNETLNLQIYNLQGQLILEEILNTDKKDIDFPAVSKGIYIVHIEGQNYQGTIKILKE